MTETVTPLPLPREPDPAEEVALEESIGRHPAGRRQRRRREPVGQTPGA